MWRQKPKQQGKDGEVAVEAAVSKTLYRVNPAADAELLPALQCRTGHGRLRLARRRGRVELRAAAQG